MDENWDFIGTFGVIKTHLNPEIWHVKHMSHPGLGWSIKTIIPIPIIANDNMKPIIMAWANICAQFSSIVTWTDIAYDWDGNKIANWQTIWVKDGYDVIEGFDINRTLVLRLTKANPGQEPIILKLIDNLTIQMAQCNNIKELEDLLEIAESLLTQTSDAASKAKRRKLKVINCE